MNEAQAAEKLDQVYQKLSDLKAVLFDFHTLTQASPLSSTDQDAIIADLQNLFGDIQETVGAVTVAYVDLLFDLTHTT